jgi:hypothetical protein
MHPSMHKYDLVFIGSGQGGGNAAIAAANWPKRWRFWSNALCACCAQVHNPPSRSAASDPGCFLAGLGQDAPAFNSETGRTALKDDEYPLGGNARYPGYSGGDFGGKACGLGFWVTLAYPAADKDWTGRYAVGVDAIGG